MALMNRLNARSIATPTGWQIECDGASLLLHKCKDRGCSMALSLSHSWAAS